MGWPRTLCLVRHAESEGNVLTVDERASTPIATHDYALTSRGREQAHITGEYLKERFGDYFFTVYYTSYYRRAKETMQLLFPHLDKQGFKVYEDPRLAEAQRGIYHTMTKEQITNRFPEELERKQREGLFHFRPLGGENWPDVELRIHSFLGTLHRDYEGDNVVIVVHGHWLILLQRLLERFSIDEAVRRYEGAVAGNASVTIYETKAESCGRMSRRLERTMDNFIPWKDKLSS